MKRRIIAACLVVIVSAFSFARGEAVDTTVDHASHVTSSLTTNFQTTTVGSTAWASTLTAPAGTTVSWLLSYKNETQVAVNKLIVYASIPANQTLVTGSVSWFDGSYPNGYVLSDTGLFNEGVQVGAIAPGVNGFIRYRTQSDATTPCGISSRANAYFEIDGVNVPYSATFSTPACAPTTPPTTTTTPSTTSPATTPDHTTHTPTPSPTTSDPVVTTTNPVVATQPTPSSSETPTSSTTVPVDHTSHTGTDVNANITTQSSEPTEPDVTEHTSVDHTTSASSAPSTVSSSSAVSEQVAHEAHVLASETTTTDSTTHESHTTTATATTEHQSSEHATHTIPATGGNPFWIMTGTLAVGYIGSLLFLNRRHASVRQL